MLHAGAGKAQLDDHFHCGDDLGPLLDTTDDYFAIEFGIYLGGMSRVV